MRTAALEAILDDPTVKSAGRYLAALCGLALIAAAAGGAVALATWTVTDPSLTHATSAPVENWMGATGAAFADPVMQLFGLAAPLLLLPPVVWGARLLAGWATGFTAARALLAVIALGLAPAAFAAAPPPESWPLPFGVGGVIGDAILAAVADVFGLAAADWQRGLIAGVIGVLAALALYRALAAPREAAREPAVPVGMQFRRVNSEDDSFEPLYGYDDEEEPVGRGGRLSALWGAVQHTLLTWKSERARRPRRSRRPRRGAAAAQAVGSRLRAALFNVDDVEDAEDPAAFRRREAAGAARQRREPSLVGRWAGAGAASRPLDGADLDEADDDWPEEDGLAEVRDGGQLAFQVLDDAEEDWDDTTRPQPQPRAVAAGRDARRGAADAGGRLDPSDRRMADPRGVPAAAATGAAPRGAPPSLRVEQVPLRMKPGRRVVREAQPSFLRDHGYEFPPLHLLTSPPPPKPGEEASVDALEQNARMLEGVLEDFGVRGEIFNVRPGPVVTLYELEPAPGIKSSRVIGLADDIARSMSAISARVAVIPGKNAIGIELPNSRRITVFLRELLASADFERTKARLPLCLGKTIGGEAVIADLAKMPHLLVAGTTGSGKSVSINTMILSLLYRLDPEVCRLIMIDPKMLELSTYEGIPHLLTPVVTDPKKAVVALKWAVREMEDRYRMMAKLGVRNIDGYNQRVREAEKKGQPLTRVVQTGFDPHTGEAIFEEERLSLAPIPYIVIIVDEMADLMMVAGKDIEGAIQRLAQMARAAGIHLIMATQRPSVDVITGTIKANFPTRISFQVTSKIDSRTILGEMGAEQLLGMGDMLYMAGGGRIQRVHGPFVDDNEVEDIVAHLKLQGVPDYLNEITEDDDDEDSGDGSSGSSGVTTGFDDLNEAADLYDRAVAVVLRDGKVSTSYIQRRLGIGYNRAASIIEKMEKEGVVSPANHAGKREILVPTEEEAM